MFKNLEIFRMSNAMAVHAATRQTVVAQNLANADTPGYAARDLIPFAETLQTQTRAAPMRTTREKHFGFSNSGAVSNAVEQSIATSPNGNGVSLEEEMIKAVDIKHQHDRALAIYKSGLSVLRTSLGRR